MAVLRKEDSHEATETDGRAERADRRGSLEGVGLRASCAASAASANRSTVSGANQILARVRGTYAKVAGRYANIPDRGPN